MAKYNRINDKNKVIDIASIIKNANHPPALLNEMFNVSVRNVIRNVINELIAGTESGLEMKIDKAFAAVSGNFAAMGAGGSLEDSGFNPQDFEKAGAFRLEGVEVMAEVVGQYTDTELLGLCPGAAIIVQQYATLEDDSSIASDGGENGAGENEEPGEIEAAPRALYGLCLEADVLRIFWDREVSEGFCAQLYVLYKNIEL